MNVASLRAEVKYLLSAGGVNNSRVTDAIILDALNVAYLQVARLQPSRAEVSLTASSAGQASLPVDMAEPLAVRCGPSELPLAMTTAETMLYINPSWRDADPGVPRDAFLLDATTLQIHPPPAASYEALVVEGFFVPVAGGTVSSPLVDDTDSPDFRVDFHIMLAYDATAILCGGLLADDPMAAARRQFVSERYTALYNDFVAWVNRWGKRA